MGYTNFVFDNETNIEITFTNVEWKIVNNLSMCLFLYE